MLEGWYYSLNFDSGKYLYITKHSGGERNCGINIKYDSNRNSFNREGSSEKWRTDINCDVQLATFQQMKWLEACIKADKFIPFEEFNKETDYLIFN